MAVESPWDHNAECKYCDEQGYHRADCPWLESLITEVERKTAALEANGLGRIIRRAKELGVVGEQADDELAVDGIIRTLERLGTLEERRDLEQRIAQLTLGVGQCLCRTKSCQHDAYLHHNGVCEVCNAGLCWC